jgi:hypothetical protein
MYSVLRNKIRLTLLCSVMLYFGLGILLCGGRASGGERKLDSTGIACSIGTREEKAENGTGLKEGGDLSIANSF